jgi:Uma2 family endonuclease
MVKTNEAPPQISSIQAPPAEHRLTLYNVRWDTYEKLLEAFGEHRAVRFTYDEGVLELMVPLEAHENPSDVIGDFIKILTIESGLNIKSMASTTLRSPILEKGAEPDKCYYIQHEPLVRGKTVDLETDPPPDLALEVDISHTDINKNRLYASLGIPEFWRFNGQNLKIHQLIQGKYQEVEVSPTFPWMTKALFYQFVSQCKTQGEAQAHRELRKWVQTNHPPDGSLH